MHAVRRRVVFAFLSAVAVIAVGARPAFATAGALDTSFGGDGKVTTSFKSGGFATSVALQAGGKIVAAGSSGGGFTLVRYNHNGTLDRTFGGDGKVTTHFVGSAVAFGVAIQSDGKIVAAGRAGGPGGRFALARYKLGGRLDTTFSRDGKVTTRFNR